MLDHLVALLVLRECNDVDHNFTEDEFVQDVARQTLDALLDHTAAERVHAEFVHVRLEVLQHLAQRLRDVQDGVLVALDEVAFRLHDVVAEPFVDHFLHHVVRVLVFDHLVDFGLVVFEYLVAQHFALLQTHGFETLLDHFAPVTVVTGCD